MSNILKFLSGKKTYIVGLGFIGMGAFMISQNQSELGMSKILEGLAIMSGRAAIGKIGQ